MHEEKSASVSADDRWRRPHSLGDPVVALSCAQRVVWFELQVNPECGVYVLAGYLRVDGPIEPSRLECALRCAVDEYDALRLTFHEQDGIPCQRVNEASSFDLQVLDFEGAEAEQRGRTWMDVDAALSFTDLTQPLFQFTLLRTGPQRNYWYMKFSHLVFDGWSSGTFIGRVTQLYGALSAGEELLPQRHSYIDFIAHEQLYLKSSRYRDDAEYWTALYQSIPTPLFATRREGDASKGGNDRHSIALAGRLVDELAQLAGELRASVPDLVLAALCGYLCLEFKRTEVVVGVPTHNRVRAKFRKTPGMFTSVLPARVAVDPASTFEDQVARVAQSMRRNYRHQQYPLSDLARKLHLTPTQAKQLCDVTLSVESFGVPLEFSGHPATLQTLTRGFNRGALHVVLQLHQGREHGQLHFDYDSTVLARAEVARLSAGFLSFLLQVGARQRSPLREWPLNPEPQQAPVVGFSLGVRNPAYARTSLLERFRAQVDVAPDSTAVVGAGERLSFRQLDSNSNQLAHYLLNQRIPSGSIIGVHLPRSVDLPVAFLGVLKAGCAYLPLDPATPRERLEEMCRQARPAIILGAEIGPDSLSDRPSLDWRGLRCAMAAMPAIDPGIPVHASALAYVTYTSGSTGSPLGVMVSHRGLGNLAAAQARAFGVTQQSRVYAFASINFDASISEFAMALSSGATLDFGPSNERLLGERLCTYLRDAAVTHVTLPPSLLRVLSQAQIPEGTSVIAAGEDCPRAVIEEQRWAQIFNAYGPTEATVCASIHKYDAATAGFPIGRPIPNTQLYILDDEMQRCPIGVTGVLYVGGIGVGWGYLNQPTVSAERFLPDPFSDEVGARMYCTGDLAKWRPDGNAEFCGRVDRQLKVRGHRVEPAEVEEALARHPCVKAAVVTPYSRADDTGGLAAYLAVVDSPRELHDQHVSEWRELYDELFRSPAIVDGEGDFTGWTSSYSGEPISSEEMAEWVEETVSDIKALRPRRVLEIGCGAGLLLSRLAPECEAYVGLDLSAEVLKRASGMLKRAGLAHVQLMNLAAHELDGFDSGYFDTVVLNSVVQYFPSLEYLEQVLREALRATRSGGAIYLGDVRCLQLLRAFCSDVEAQNAAPETTAEQLKRRVETRAYFQDELLVAPEWFADLSQRLAGVSARTRLKLGVAQNELTRFRYQVLLDVNHADRRHGADTSERSPLAAPKEHAWRDGESNLDTIDCLLSDDSTSCCIVRSIPNARLAHAAALLRWLEQGGSERLADWQAHSDRFVGGVQPCMLQQLARRHMRKLALRYAGDGNAFAMDAVFYADREPAWELSQALVRARRASYANEPTSKRLFQSLVPEVHASVQATLPGYMLPSAYALVKTFPLTLNGKLDYSALPPARPLALLKSDSRSAPTDDLERALIQVWSGVLGVQVGTDDSFIELGGDSIQCLQVVSKARDIGIQLSAKQIFEGRTISKISRLIRDKNLRLLPHDDASARYAPLTPIQRWFFEQPLETRAHFNQFVLVSPSAPLEPAVLARALALVEREHASLRLRFRETDVGWQQWIAPTAHLPFEIVDVRHLPAEQQLDAISADARNRQNSLKLESGPIWSAAYYRVSPGTPDQFIWLIHHLAVDGFSWRLLLDDLESAYRQLLETNTFSPPRASTAFIDWAVRLDEYAETLRSQAQPQASTRAPTPTLPLSGGINVVQTVLSGAPARQLTWDAPVFFDCSTQDLLLTALKSAWHRWSDATELSIVLEGHGREEAFDDVDISRTTGWFTTLFPLRLEIESDSDAATRVSATRSQLQGIGRKAFDYGVRGNFSLETGAAPALGQHARPALSFNYLGHIDVEPSWIIFKNIEARSFGLSLGDREPRPSGLELQVIGAQGQYDLTWRYDSAVHDHVGIERLATLFVEAIRDLLSLAPTAAPIPRALSSESVEQRAVAHLTRETECAYPLSPTQEGILFHSLAESSSHTYFEQVLFTIQGELHIPRFWQAWELLIERNEILRTRFIGLDTGTPLQEVRHTVNWPRLTLDWQGEPEAVLRQRLAELIEQDRLQKFVLAKAPLFRLTLARAKDDRTYLLWSHHHVVLDGWSVALLIRELFVVYRALTQAIPLRRTAIAQYRDYVTWLTSPDGHEQATAYWRQSLAGFTVPTPLNFANAEEGTREQRFRESRLVLSESLSNGLLSLSKSANLTLGILFQGAWALLLSRSSSNCDVVFGSASSGRSAPIADIESIPGLFIHTLPVRVRLEESCRAEAFLEELQRAQVEREALHPLGLLAIQKCSEIPQGDPLFESLVVIENYPRDLSLLAELDLRLEVEHLGVRTNYPVTLLVTPGDRVELRLAYDAHRFSERVGSRVLGWLEHLLQQIVEDPGQPLHRLSLLDRASHVELIRQYDRSAERALPKRTLVDLFAEQARTTPQRAALIQRRRTMSYAQLDRESDAIAVALGQRGVRPERLVGVCLERSMRLIAAILGILKAGGAYVPLDPNHPVERLRLIAQRAKLQWILTSSTTQNKLSSCDAELIDVDGAVASAGSGNAETARATLHEENLAYVLHTSGSTGVPKGVAISASSPVALIDWARGVYTSEELRRTLFSTSINFDLSVFEIFAPLCLGGGVVIADNVLELRELNEVTLVNTVPSAMMELLRLGVLPATVTTVNLAGEPVPRSLVRDLRAVPTIRKVYNLYGPSETTTYSTFANLDPTRSLPPIGTPLDHEAAYILDHNLNLQAPGIPGDLYIAGRGLARGYLDDPGKTAAAFLPNPFSRIPGARLYRTGDLARYGEDGQIEFIGRKDHQVKIRGHRIELEEIESCLRRCANIADAVVTKRQDDALGEYLFAHVTLRETSARAQLSDWKDALRRVLPEYMIPQRFAVMDRLPRSPNGKLDRLALARSSTTTLASESDEASDPRPSGALWSRISGIYQRLLRISVIDRQATFFDLGGHSLLLLSLAEELRREFGVQVPLRELRPGLSVSELARLVEQHQAAAPTAVYDASTAVLQPDGDGPPLYLIGPASGSPMGYLEFAGEFAGHHPVIGLQAPGLREGEQPLQSVPELARYFLQVLDHQSHSGPFLIGGWSFGGLVAFELARQLRAQGKEAVAFLFDTEVFSLDDRPTTARSSRQKWKRLVKELQAFDLLGGGLNYAAVGRLGAWLGLALPRSLHSLAKRNTREKIAFTLDAARTVRRSARVFWCNYRAARDYRLQYLHGDVYLFRTRVDRESSFLEDACYVALASKVSGRLEAVSSPGTHMTLFDPPNRKVLADEVQARLAAYSHRQETSEQSRPRPPDGVSAMARSILAFQPDV